MNATKSAMIPIKSITINQAEGLTERMLKGTFTTWAAANAMLRCIKIGAPTDGSYYKTDVVVTWADGMIVSTREDVANSDRYDANLATNIRNLWLFYGGLKRPSHMSEENYEKIISDVSRRDTAVAYLKKYDLDDAVILDDRIIQVPKVSASEVDDAIERIARLLARIEAPEMKSVMGDAQIRTASMDMRRAIASLMRVRDAS